MTASNTFAAGTEAASCTTRKTHGLKFTFTAIERRKILGCTIWNKNVYGG
jgi:hypothetical protein